MKTMIGYLDTRRFDGGLRENLFIWMDGKQYTAVRPNNIVIASGEWSEMFDQIEESRTILNSFLSD